MIYKYPVVNMVETGLNITRLMKDNNLKIADIQEALGFENPQSIYKWKRGDSLPSIDNLIVLAYLFNTTVDKILIIDYDDNY